MRIHTFQFRLVVLMASIALLGLGLATLKQPYEPRITILLALTIGTLFVATAQARFALTPVSRAWWFGFSLLGWTHLLLVGSTWHDQLPTTIVTDKFVQWYVIHYAPYPTPLGRGAWYTNAIHDTNGKFFAGAVKVVELYLTLIIALLGAMLIGGIAAKLEEGPRTPDDLESFGRY